MLHELWFITNLFGHFSVYVSVVFVFLRLHFVIIIINNILSAREKKRLHAESEMFVRGLHRM